MYLSNETTSTKSHSCNPAVLVSRIVTDIYPLVQEQSPVGLSLSPHTLVLNS